MSPVLWYAFNEPSRYLWTNTIAEVISKSRPSSWFFDIICFSWNNKCDIYDFIVFSLKECYLNQWCKYIFIVEQASATCYVPGQQEALLFFSIAKLLTLGTEHFWISQMNIHFWHGFRRRVWHVRAVCRALSLERLVAVDCKFGHWAQQWWLVVCL